MVQGGLARRAIARLKSAGVPVAPILRRVGLTPELIADPEERLYYEFAAVHESKSGTRLPIWNVQIESVGIGPMRRDHGLVGFCRLPSRAHRLVSSGICRTCSHAV